MDAKKMGGFIAARRRALGLTQNQLAAQLHVTDKAVSRWERGRGCPDIGLLQPLAGALGISLVELMQAERAASTPLTPPQTEDILARQMIREIRHRQYTAYLIGTAVCFAALVLCIGAWFPLLLIPYDITQDPAAYSRWLTAGQWSGPGFVIAFIGLCADSISALLTMAEKLPRLRTVLLMIAAAAALCGFGLLCAACGLVFPV